MICLRNACLRCTFFHSRSIVVLQPEVKHNTPECIVNKNIRVAYLARLELNLPVQDAHEVERVFIAKHIKTAVQRQEGMLYLSAAV